MWQISIAEGPFTMHGDMEPSDAMFAILQISFVRSRLVGQLQKTSPIMKQFMGSHNITRSRQTVSTKRLLAK